MEENKMVKCELCGREFKNTQGLRGHKTFVHGKTSSSNTPATLVVTESGLSKLEGRLEKLEYITGLKESQLLNDTLNTEKPLTEKLAEVTQQLNSLTQQLASLASNTASNSDLHKISEQISQFTHQISSYSKWFQPVRTVAGTMSRLEDELSNRAQNVRVNTLENKLARLEDGQKKAEERMVKCIRDNEEANDAKINKVMEVIEHLVEKFAASLKQLQSQIGEQKQVTDWVKREYNLRPVNRAR